MKSSLVLLSVALAHVHAAASDSEATTHHSSTHRASSVAAAAAATTSLDRTNYTTESTIYGDAECSPYYYAPVGAIQSSYPDIWATANMSFAGIPDYDKSLFESMKANIPSISPRGTRAGDFSNVTYTSDDPDCWWSYNKCTTPKLSGLEADVVRCPEPDTLGFTLDDGPNCSHNAFYDYLKSQNQLATLFYVGSNVIDWPLEAQRGLAEGHEICSHTWSHPYMTSMTDEEAFAELYYSKKILKDVLGITVRCWRPPYGDVDDRIRYIANFLDLRTMIWSDDTFDYMYSTIGTAAVQNYYTNLINGGKNGTYSTEGIIILSHELDNQTMAFSEEYLPQLQAAYKGGVVPIGVCYNTTQPYIESDYAYPNYEQYTSGTRTISLSTPTAVGSAASSLALAAASSASSAASSALSSHAKSSSTKSSSKSASTSDSSSASASESTASATATAASAGHALAAPGVFRLISAVFN